ncbi:MAG TPA: LysR substrate-binding domain-containing protein [SAR86 cluster bacterium]|jgi:LysR family hydrogen peroxide-inducible transcriptional activator|nr:LysR substrate-binding domain-containing protein [SAR86 cluster bacterium]HJM15570.1 LysR substrate-binding domain-containing protein [SAR86 cluster bacterium]
MNLKDLKYFSSLAKHKNFSKAAEECFVTQPTLSNQINKLEQELGLILFERTNRRVSITEEGKLILEAAQKTLDHVSEIKKLAHKFKEPLMGKLTLGAIHTLSPYLLPIILLPLKEAFPELDLILVEATTSELIEDLKGGKIDAALLATPVRNEKNLKQLKVFKEPFWLAHPTNHKIYNVDNITVKHLQNLDLLLLPEEHCLSDQVKSVCGLKNMETEGPMQWLHAGSLETILQFVAMGQGSTLVPALAVYEGRINTQGMMVRKLDIDQAYRNISISFRKDYSKESDLKVLSKFIQDNLPNIVEPI